ncbi:MAG: 4'-phosphopantetheinyl transferase superfamily protein [Xanthomonadales bacterium]|nr:4'-phosphopantetheinyl transferase superfamily protein [Xanthomonadales bacterium]
MEKITTITTGPGSFSPVHLPLRALEKPQGNDVHLWYLDLRQLSNPLSSNASADSAEFPIFQQRATQRFYLRLLLGAYLGVPGKDIHITRRVRGRPELDAGQTNGELNFSVARSSGCYLIGVSSGATIGVDMEMAKRRPGKPLALARRYFSQQEISALSILDDESLRRAFMHTWACKEAIVKASGMGIANQLCRFSVDVDPDRPPSVLDMPDDDPGAWKLAIAEPAPDTIAVVAVRQPSLRLAGFRLSK